MLTKKYPDVGLLALRVVAGAFMIYGHGWGKMMRLFGGEEISFADPFGLGPVASLSLAVFAEVVCALLLILGLFNRWANIPLIITMAVAAFIQHGDDPFSRKEKALLFLIIFVTLLLTGPGKYSLDTLLFKNRKGSAEA